MILLSISGLFRMVLIILGVIVLLRFIGQIMVAKRNASEERRYRADNANTQSQVNQARANFGKTTVSKLDQDQFNQDDYVDYEEIKE